MTGDRTGEGSEGARDPAPPPYCRRHLLTTLRDEDITTTTNTLPAGDADQGDSNEQQVDPAGVDTGGGDADGGDSSDGDSSDGEPRKGDADSSDS